MISLHLSHVSFSYSTAVPVFTDVDLDLGPGWYGVVGPNGAGKSTLLDLVAGTLAPTGGDVRRVAASTFALVPQESTRMTAEVERFADRWDGHAAGLRSRLGLDPDDLGRWSTLSPGERTRWATGAALALEPDLLLLDEPTNHLDSDGRQVLLDALFRFEGIGLVVSHDRELLDRLTTSTIRVSDGTVELRTGNYTEARAGWELEDRQRREAHARSRKEERRLAAEASRLAQARSGAERGAAEARRTGGHRDHDAHSTVRKFRAANAAAAHARRAGVAARRLERQQESTASIGVRRDRGGSVTLAGGPSRRRILAELVSDELAAPDGTALLADVDLRVGSTDRIHVRGDNGAGKTTLLRALLAATSVPEEERMFLAQELGDEEVASLQRRLSRLDRDTRGRVLGIAANLGADPARLLATERPSPGEARKLALSFALGSSSSFVILDEPTNHLDLPTIERLEEAIDDYAGALLLVTHDLALAERVTDVVWSLEGGAVVVQRPMVP